MIQLVDDFLQLFILNRIKWLKAHPIVIDQIFHTGKFETVEKIKDFIINKKIRVMIGYPREQTSLPAYSILLAPEQEKPLSLGNDFESFDSFNLGGDIDPEREYMGGYDDDEKLEYVKDSLKDYLARTGMTANYRIECWSDNGDLTSYMYAILKWCLWTCQREMMDLGWVDINLSGTDLEPAPEYMSAFIYRRALQIRFTYENLYYENMDEVGKILDILEHPENYPDLDMDRWVVYPNYYDKGLNLGMKGV